MPWGVKNYDPELKFQVALLHFCNTENVDIVSYNDVSEMMRRI